MSGEWLHWYYMIYLLPAGTAILVLLMSGLGGPRIGLRAPHGGLRLHMPRLGGHHGAAPRVPHGGSTSSASAPHGGHSPAAPRPVADGRAHHGSRPSAASPSVLRQMLGFFGLGRAPLPIVLGSLLIGWGFFGLSATEALRPILRLPALVVGPSMMIAAAGALVMAKLFAELSARFMPRDESYALTRDGLLGLTGRVVYPVTESTGRVHLYDQYHTLHVASARIAPGEAPIERGTEVIVASEEPNHRYLIVEPLGFSTGRSALPEAERMLEERNG